MTQKEVELCNLLAHEMDENAKISEKLEMAIRALEYCKALATGRITPIIRDSIYGKCLITIESLKKYKRS